MGQLQSFNSQSLHVASQESQQLSDSHDGHNVGASPAALDKYQSRTVSEVEELVKKPRQLGEGEDQAEQVLLDVQREVVDADLEPTSVLLHVYDVRSGLLQDANDVLAFSMDKAAVGGAFHAGVEVFGSEWSYGTLGVRCDPPRTITGHVYRCSLLLGETDLSEEEVAEQLCEIVQEWSAHEYEFLGHNCCTFARELVERLQVGPLPPWVDRFARVLDQGVTAATETSKITKQVGSVVRRVASRVIGQSAEGVKDGLEHIRVYALPEIQRRITIHGRQISMESESDMESLVSRERSRVDAIYVQDRESPTSAELARRPRQIKCVC
jgi:hypothetical protein